MRAHTSVVWLIPLLLLAPGTARASAPTTREILGSELLVKEYLEKFDIPSGPVQPLADDLLAQAFPNHLFFVVAYPPAAAANLPEPLKPVNVFAVDPEGRVKLLVGPTEFVELFKSGFNPGTGVDRCRVAVRIALLLVRARYPEYTFALADEVIKIIPEGMRGKRGIGKLVVKEGGSGAIEVVLTLDRNCDPLKVVETITLKPVRVAFAPPPTAVITKAEKTVKAVLVEAKLPVDTVQYINDPVLVKTFPGHLLFVVPNLDPAKVDPGKGMDIIVVDPRGKTERLFGHGNPFGRWINTTFGPARGDPRIREELEVLVHLMKATHPNFTFGKVPDPQITTEENGIRTIVNKVPVTGPGGKPWLLTARLTFGRGGRLIAWSWGFRPA